MVGCLLGVLFGAEVLEAQLGRDSLRRVRERAEEKRTRLLEEHSAYLERARENRILEEYLQGDEDVGRRVAESLPASVLGRDGGVDAAQLAREREGADLIEAASRNLSEEARAIVAKRPVIVAQADPVPGVAPSAPAVLPDPGKVPMPEELKPKPLVSKRGLLAEITAEGAVHFDAATNMMVFTEDVVVDHTGFHLECDRLEIILKPNVAIGVAGDEGAAEEGEGEGGAGVMSVDGDDPIEQAIASGGMVTITKKDAQGKLKTGKARKVVYEAETGDITMREFPQVQSGQSLMISTDPSTIIVMKADGNHYAVGPHRMEIVAEEEEDERDDGADAAAAAGGGGSP
ncbi:MAG: LptA/OstA family protein [Verrucomicrobiota bacterium]